jgi:hypothetical protein
MHGIKWKDSWHKSFTYRQNNNNTCFFLSLSLTFYSLSLYTIAAPLIIIFSGEIVFSGAVAGGGNTASELKTSPFPKQITSFKILFRAGSKSTLKISKASSQHNRSKL